MFIYFPFLKELKKNVRTELANQQSNAQRNIAGKEKKGKQNGIEMSGKNKYKRGGIKFMPFAKHWKIEL